MRECRVNLFDFGGGQRVHAIGAVVEDGAGPGGAVLHVRSCACLTKLLREVQSFVEFGERTTHALAQRDIHGIGSGPNVAGTGGGRNLS